jgi:hypothetical protein
LLQQRAGREQLSLPGRRNIRGATAFR